jgi:hypothetical protein
MCIAPAARAQTWAGGAGDWNVPANWIGGIIPNDPATDVRIDGGSAASASSVTLANSMTLWKVRALTIDPGDALTIGGVLTAFGPVSVGGTLKIGAGFSPGANFFIDSPVPVTVGGPGTIAVGSYYDGNLQARNGLTIAPDLVVQGHGYISGGSKAVVTNLGTVRAQGGTLNILNFTNRGAVEVASGATLELGSAFTGAWRNEGTINLASGSSLTLGGTFTLADVMTIRSESGTSTCLIGTLDNTGNVLELGKSVDSLTMSNTGGIKGGTISASGGARLVIHQGSAGVLDGVTLATNPLFGLSAYLAVRNGLTLNDVVLDLTAGGQLGAGNSIAGTGLLAGRGEVKLGSFISESQSYTGNVLSGLTISPDISVHGAGAVSYLLNLGRIAADVPQRTLTLTGVTNQSIVAVAPGALLAFTDSTNEGAITVAAGSTISLKGNWRNPGTITMAGSSSLVISGPFAARDLAGLTYTGPDTAATVTTTIDNTAADLDVAAVAQTLTLKGATVLGGTLTASAGSRLVIASPTLTNHVNVFDSVALNVSPNFADTLAEIEVHHGLTLRDVSVDLSTGGTLAFAGDQPQPLSGSGQVILWGPLKNKGQAPVTISAGILVRGRGNVTGPFVNEGNIRSDTQTISLSNIDNAGTIQATNKATLLLASGSVVTNRGLITIDAGGTLRPVRGTLTQAAGLLNVNGLLDNQGTLTLVGGTLSGTGVIQRSVAPETQVPPLAPDDASLVISPGASPDGSATLGTLTINDPAGFNVPGAGRVFIELGAHGASDRLQFQWGSLRLAAGASLDLATIGDVPFGSQFVVATYSGTLTGAFTNISPGFDVSYATPHQIVVTVTPEPAGMGLLGMLAAATFARRPRHRRHPRTARRVLPTSPV